MTFDLEAFRLSVLDDPLVRDVWDQKYRWKEADGSSAEPTVAHTRARVVDAIYVNDENIVHHRRAYDAVQGGLLVPAGRVNAGAGLGRNVTLINCFISETVQDSMPGIQRAIMRGALTLQGTGGLGTDWSPVRPRRALVAGSASEACGVVPFMDQMDAMCRTIAVNDRRGALMATLRDDHPDLWNERQFETTTNHVGETVLKFPSFISAKRQRGRLTQCNMSILVSDAFLAAVSSDGDWDLGFHKPPADGSYVDVVMKPLPHDVYDDDNEIVSVPGSEDNVTYAPMVHGKGTHLPWYVYTRVKARRIWDDIMRSTYVYAEPGIIFIDRVNARNSLWYCEDIRCSNPCGEKPMPPDGICALSSLNAAFMVADPFTRDARFDFDAWTQTTATGVRFIDNVLDVSRYPLVSQRREALNKRRIGLGVTGFGSALVQLGLPYGSDESVDLSNRLSTSLRDGSYYTSAILAKERGPFPAYDRDKFMRGYNFSRLPERVKDAISDHGIRNGELNTIAPNGTISLYIGNVSSGHEPVFSFAKTDRKVRQRDNSFSTYQSMDYSLRLYEAMFGVTKREDLPTQFVGAMDISVEDHLVVHAAWQDGIDAGVSKTINCPTSMSFDDFSGVYTRAYDLGCKGVTTYRPDPASGRGSVLSETAADGDKVLAPLVVNLVVPELNDLVKDAVRDLRLQSSDIIRSRPDVVEGRTHKLKWPPSGENVYVTVTHADGVPLEIFIKHADATLTEWTDGLSRMVTGILRRGGDVRFVVDQLKQVGSVKGGAFWGGAYQMSQVAAIGSVIERELRTLGVYETPPAEEETTEIATAPLGQVVWGTMCPKCTEMALIRENGCRRCLKCTYEACG